MLAHKLLGLCSSIYTAKSQSEVMMNATMNATARAKNQTQKGTDPEPVHLQKTGIPAETEQIWRGLGVRDRR